MYSMYKSQSLQKYSDYEHEMNSVIVVFNSNLII